MNFITLQQSITTTGTAQNLPSNPVIHSITIHAPSTNSASIIVGNGSAVTALTGFVLEKGNSVTVRPANLNQLWIVGSVVGDSCSIVGS